MPLVGLTGGYDISSAEAKVPVEDTVWRQRRKRTLAPCKQLPCKPPNKQILYLFNHD